MTLLGAWLVFPVLLGAVTLGSGLLLERCAGIRLAFPLLPGVGLATSVVAMSLFTMFDATAELAVPALVALATGGLVVGASTLRDRAEPWALGAALVTFLAFGAPILASGEATFAGYVKLDDTATSLGLLDRVLEHGRSVAGLEPSTYEAMLSLWLGDAYPVGSLLPLGLTHLVDLDPAWTWQPYLCVLAAILALVLYELSAEILSTRWLRALAAAAASSSALLFGYALWGGVKELFAAALLALLAATVPLVRRKGPRAAIVPAVAAAAFLDGLSVAGAIWLVPLVAAAVALAWRSRSWVGLGIAAVAGVILAVPALWLAPDFLDNANAVARGTDNVGNLFGPLSPWQLAGIWPTSDFRLEPDGTRATIVLVGVAVVAAGLGTVIAVQRRAWRVLALLGTALAGAVVFLVSSGPWIEGKALAAASPMILFLALLAGGALVETGRRVEGLLVLGALVGGVAWSNVLASTEPYLAPRDRLAELESIGERFAGQGPALMTEYQPYGVRHFLRRLDPEGASELRRRLVPLRDGQVLTKGATAQIDAFAPEAVLAYRTLVLLRSGPGGVPPVPFRLVQRGRHYDVWQRSP